MTHYVWNKTEEKFKWNGTKNIKWSPADIAEQTKRRLAFNDLQATNKKCPVCHSRLRKNRICRNGHKQKQ